MSNSGKTRPGSLVSLLGLTLALTQSACALGPTVPPENLTAQFVPSNPDGTSRIVVDGVRDAAYASSPVALIDNAKNAAANADAVSLTKGELRSVWDGRTLYLLVEVTDSTPANNPALPAWGASSATNFDGVEFALDFWNDKVDKFEDDDGLFTISRDGRLTYVPNAGVVNHQSVHAFKDGREYTNRIKDYKVVSTPTGYAVELALQISGTPLVNGTALGLDVMISDAPADNTARTARIYWSHADNAYPASSQDHPMDWGIVTLAGWDGLSRFAYNDWHLTNQIRWADSRSLVKGVWRAATDAELQAALANGRATLASVGTATDATAQAAIDSAATRLANAIRGLRWSLTKYPDPLELPSLFTLPNPWKFFNGTPVISPDEWWGANGRRAEILDLAQYYEYGYKPAKPDSITIASVTGTTQPVINATVTYGAKSANIAFTLNLPNAAQLAASGHAGGPVPVILGFGANTADYLNAGYAVLAVPTNVTTDDRNNPWGASRSGTFRTFFPYTRDNDPNEISNEMGAAWGASIAIDVLEKIVAAKTPLLALGTADTLVAPDKLAVTGFSIFGKYAFVSAVFDDRIDVCIPGAAGSTGPAPYRYISYGHQYSWGQSGGGEVMGDTIRHNPGRTTELFRRFLEPFRFYLRKPGAWGYGDRLPFDQNDLVATLAPRALVLHHTIDDYGNNSEGDALSLSVAKIVYRWLGVDADAQLKFNFRATGGHGEDATQRQRSARFLDQYFYGKPLAEADATHLNTNPFLNDGAYDRYFGGLATMAPWAHSRDIALTLVVDPASIPEGLPADVDVAVQGSNLKGRTLTASLVSPGGTVGAETPVTSRPGDWDGVWMGTFHLPAAPAAGNYKVIVKVKDQAASAEKPLTITPVGAVAVAGTSSGNKQANVDFDIRSANGKGYVTYVSTTGEPASFAPYDNVNYNSKGVHLKGLANGTTYHVFVAYVVNGTITERTSVVTVTPGK